MTPDMHPRILAFLGPAALQTSLSDWRLPNTSEAEDAAGVAPSPTQNWARRA